MNDSEPIGSRKPSHLRRLARIFLRQPVYFVTTCTAGRRRCLADPVFHSVCRESWETGCRIHGWAVGQYVIMPEHVHFFCRAEPGAASDLSRFVGSWKEWTGKRMRRDAGWRVPLWQAEFFDHVIRSEESLDEKWQYVCRNPERAGLVGRWEEWPHQGSLTEWVRVIAP